MTKKRCDKTRCGTLHKIHSIERPTFRPFSQIIRIRWKWKTTTEDTARLCVRLMCIQWYEIYLSIRFRTPWRRLWVRLCSTVDEKARKTRIFLTIVCFITFIRSKPYLQESTLWGKNSGKPNDVVQWMLSAFHNTSTTAVRSKNTSLMCSRVLHVQQ